MFFVYIIYSEKCDRYYTGYSQDISLRLERHNNGLVAATRNCRPYILKGYKGFENESDARREEIRIKKQKSRKYIEYLINGNW